MSNNKSLKILVSYYKPSLLIKKDDQIIPIHVGRDIKNKELKNINSSNLNFMLKNMIGDNTGDNISSKNRQYYELTAIYWAWKNYDKIGNPDYIGFMNNKKLLNLMKKGNNKKSSILDFNEKISNSIGYSQKNIEKILSNYDIVLPEIYTTHPIGAPHYIISNYELYRREHIIKDLKKVINIIDDEDYEKDINDHLYDTKGFFFNMFIMKKEIFFKYCEWLFSILFKYEKIRNEKRDIEENQNNDILYISYFLLNIFVRRLIRKEEINTMNADIVNVNSSRKVNKSRSLKVLISYDKPSLLIKKKGKIIPIHVGREIKNRDFKDKNITSNDLDFMFKNMIGDDTGNNISSKNIEYCELTAIYWAWKNYDKIGNPDYIGFMNKQKLLNLMRRRYIDELKVKKFDDEVASSIGYSKKNIKKILSNYDIVLPEIYTTHPIGAPNDIMTNYSFYKREHLIKDLKKVIDIINNEYEDYKIDMNDYLYDTKSFFSNMFIMKKEIFFKYCEWLFSILFKYEKIRGDRTNIEINQNREMAYLSDRLLNIFIRNLIRKEEIRIMHTNIINVNNSKVMNKDKSLKVLVSYHKPSLLIKEDDQIIPIHVGRELKNKESKDGSISSNDLDFMFKNMIGDDTGENISSKNREYCELTAIYWAWKNYDKIGNPDYIGFMHYRRLLNIMQQSKNRKLEILDFNKKIADSIGYSKKNIKKILSNYDIVLPTIYMTHPIGLPQHIMTNYSFYEREHIIEDLDKVIDIINNEYEEYKKDMNDYLYDARSFFFNMFIMKKEIFFKYCEWLFSILFKYEKIRGDRTNIEINQNREIGYISERLLNIFVRHLVKKENVSVMHTDVVQVISKIEKLDLNKVKLGNKDISKIRNQKINNNAKKINIVYSSDNNYAQHCCCSMASILLNSDEESYFNFIILDGGIKEENKNKILALKKIKNFDIHFYDMKSVDFYDDFKLNREYISIATYYRLIMFNILDKDIEKIIYIDCDTIVETNIRRLWDIDIKDYSALVVDDECGVTQCKRIGLPIKNRYFNAGLSVFNVKKLREYDFYKVCIKCYRDNEEIITLQDQDILNIVLNGKCKYLDLNWNTNSRLYLGNNLKGFDIPYFESSYSKKDADNAKYNPYILHYTDSVKPWNINCVHPLRKEYFKYLKFTEFKSYIMKFYFNKYIFNINKNKKYIKIKLLFLHLTIKQNTQKNNKK